MSGATDKLKPSTQNHDDHDHSHANGDVEHTHSHSVFGHTHTHAPEEKTRDAEQIIAALKGTGKHAFCDRGSYITLVGLFSNIGLTAAKGLAGWYMHSASLLADAGHSMSDLLGDFVTLICWKLSRKPPSQRYPYGFAKFETIGTTTISILLIGGALGIGFHSYHLLMTALADTAAHMPPSQFQSFLELLTSTTILPDIGHGHVHAVDPNAAWFAAVSVFAKEYLYRITKVVADEEKSPVLLANAIHHRSDAYSSFVAFVAIMGTWMFPAFPLDPIGGLFVSAVILQQGLGLLKGAWGDLTDAAVSDKTRQSLMKTLDLAVQQHNESDANAIAKAVVHNLRARRAGSLIFVDITVEVPATATVAETSDLENHIKDTLKAARREVSEVMITFAPISQDK
ncbi:hypothetical protein CVT24_005140 [Panaeolus cyanescens]|uniref:Uncharacterized protein n=1 Tax=Panaeolus cyanescens TaxID=181874 RepID=A0A409V9Q4_9AGAR|nr:hypothetical protein CVT24_005140 [Panaeolus cyanescens]